MDGDQSYDIQRALQEMRADYWRNLEVSEEETSTGGEDYLVILLGSRRCGLRASLCSEVLKLPRMVRVPRLPDYIRGIFNLRGEIVAITDLCPLLGSGTQDNIDGSRLVVVSHGAIKTALLVQSVEGLMRVDPAHIEPLTDGVAAGMRDLFKGKLVDADEPLMLLDLESILARPELLIDQKSQNQ